jgi:hypothetical protein
MTLIRSQDGFGTANYRATTFPLQYLESDRIGSMSVYP